MHEPSHRSIPSIRPCMHLCRVSDDGPPCVLSPRGRRCAAREASSLLPLPSPAAQHAKEAERCSGQPRKPAVCVVERKRACSGDAMCEIGRRVSLSALGERSIFVSESGRRSESNEGRAGLYNTGAVRSVAAAGRHYSKRRNVRRPPYLRRPCTRPSEISLCPTAATGSRK
jgi:hypothetical protein